MESQQQQHYNKMSFIQSTEFQCKSNNVQMLPFFMLINSQFNKFSQNGLHFDSISKTLGFMKQITCTYMYVVLRLLNKRALASDLLYAL